MPNRDFLFRAVRVNLRYLELIRLEISRRTRWWCLKCLIVYLGLLKKEEELEERRRMPNRDFLLRAVRTLFSVVVNSFEWKSAVEHDGGV